MGEVSEVVASCEAKAHGITFHNGEGSCVGKTGGIRQLGIVAKLLLMDST